MAKSPFVETFVHGLKDDMDANVATLFEREFSGGQVSWATSKLGQQTWPPENSKLNTKLYCLLIFSGIRSLASNNHVLG